MAQPPHHNNMSYFELSALTENINSTEGLNHAVLQSLLNYAKAQINDPIEKGQNQQGWWASEFINSVGCRDWTLAREKQTTETLTRAKTHTKKALNWLIQQKTAKSIQVETHYQNEKLIRQITITLQNDNQTEITL